MAKKETVELEATSLTDGAWYDCEVSIDKKKGSKPRLRVHFVEFSAEEDEFHETAEGALANLRSRSKPMEESDCAAVREGDVMLTLQKKASEQKYYDAQVVKIKREPHGSGRTKCKCSYDLKWLASNKAGQTAKLKFTSLCITTKRDPKLNKTFGDWLKAVGYQGVPEKADSEQKEPPPETASQETASPKTDVREASPDREIDKEQLDHEIMKLIKTFSTHPGEVDSTPRRELALHMKQALQGQGAVANASAARAHGSALAHSHSGHHEVGPGDIAHEAIVFGPGIGGSESLEATARYDVFSSAESSVCSHCGTIPAGALAVAPLEAQDSSSPSKACLRCFVARRTSFLDPQAFRLCYLSPDNILNAVNQLIRLQKLPQGGSQPSLSQGRPRTRSPAPPTAQTPLPSASPPAAAPLPSADAVPARPAATPAAAPATAASPVPLASRKHVVREGPGNGAAAWSGDGVTAPPKPAAGEAQETARRDPASAASGGASSGPSGESAHEEQARGCDGAAVGRPREGPEDAAAGAGESLRRTEPDAAVNSTGFDTGKEEALPDWPAGCVAEKEAGGTGATAAGKPTGEATPAAGQKARAGGGRDTASERPAVPAETRDMLPSGTPLQSQERSAAGLTEENQSLSILGKRKGRGSGVEEAPNAEAPTNSKTPSVSNGTPTVVGREMKRQCQGVGAVVTGAGSLFKFLA